MSGIQYINHQAAHPVSGDMRQNPTNNTMEIYNGMTWTTINPGWVESESLAESVAHALDDIGGYIAEDCPGNRTIQDAYAEWRTATERFLVILAMAEK